MGRTAAVTRQTGSSRGPLASYRGALLSCWDSVRWYWGSLMGDNHYRRYVALRGRTHPGEPVLSEGEYWRMRHAATESNPNPRCC